MKFTDSRFSKELNPTLNNTEMLLLGKVIAAIYPATAYLYIAHQLQLLLTSLLSLNKLNLPKSLRQNNDELIRLLTKVTNTEIYKRRIFNERIGHATRNPLHGMMLEYPVASLFSISFNVKTNENLQQIFYCAISLIFWISFNKAPKDLIEKQSEDLRKFLVKNNATKINTSITSFKLNEFIDEWAKILKSEGVNWEHQPEFSRHARQLNDIETLLKTKKLKTSLIHHISNIAPIKNITPDVKVSTQKRRYIPLLKHKEDLAEDNSIDLTDISVKPDHYIDEEALDQSYLYGSRLALQELMQLSLRPVALLDHEVSMITRRIEQALLSDNNEEVKGAVLTFLLLCTSKGYDYIEALPINCNEEPNSNTDYICLKTKSWNRFDVRMPDAFTATEEQKKYLEKVEHLLCLPIPTILITALEKLINEKNVENITVQALFKGNQEDFLISAYITEFFSNAPKLGRNITPASIRNLLFELISKKESPAVASLLLANTEYASNTSLYYLFQSHQKMVLLYQNSIRELGFESHDIEVESDLFCGSELAIRLWRSKLIVSEKYNDIVTNYKHIDDRSPLAESTKIHNQITLYCALSLLITTGHRTRNEYSFSDFTIYQEKELILIADKQNFCDSSVRILPIADVVTENLKAYRIHCDRLSRITQQDHPLLTQQLLKTSQNQIDTNQPLLYLINDDFTTKTVGHKDIEAYLNMWDLPSNAFRHYFFSFLQSTSAKTVAGNLMGHIRSGEHIFANDSLFCNDDMAAMKSAINILADSLNCIAISFPAKVGRKVPLPDYQSNGVYIPQCLQLNKSLNKKNLRNSVRKLIHDAYQNKTQFFKDIPTTRDELLTNILEEANLTTSKLNYKLKILDKFINRLVGNNKLPSISKAYADNDTEKLRLSTDSIFKAKEAELVALTIQNWILSKKQNESMSKNAANREFLKVLLSLIVNASFSLTIDVDFIRALKSPIFKEGNILWITWTDSNDKKQRIIIDAVTAQIIINNPIYLKTKLKHPSEISKTLFHYLSRKIKKLPIQKTLVGNKRIDINILTQFLNNRFFFTHTGLSQSYLNQKQQTTHLPDEVLTRWLSDSPCYKETSEATESKEFKAQSLLQPKRKKCNDTSVLLGVKILHAIREQLNQMLSQSGCVSTEMLIDTVSNSWANIANFSPESNLQEMINQSTLLSEATIAALCWLHHTAGKPGRGRKTIAIRTLLSYISKVVKPLIITASSQPFFSLEKSELENLYIKVIESRKVKNKNEAAEVLRIFNNQIYDSFKISKVSWLEIEPSIYGKTDNVKANIINYREYKEIRLHLGKNDSFTNDERLINQTIFTLCCRLGLRISEAENLMINEIDFEHGIIHIKTNRYDRVKSLKSNRRIPFELFLSKNEVNDLKQLVQRALQFHNQKTNVGIFSRPLDHSKLIDFTEHAKAITQVMKSITHDPSMSPHIGRHSFASYLFLFVCRGELPPSINNELKHWSREQDDYQQFTKKLTKILINEHNSPHKLLHAISLMLGHEDTTTTIKHYVHVLDITSAAENEKLLNQALEIKQTKWVNKLSISHANKIVSRFDEQQRRHIAISYHQLKKFTDYAEVDVVRIKDKTPFQNELQCNKTGNSLLYNLSIIEVIVRAAEDNLKIEEIVKNVTFSEIEIKQTIQITERLKSKTGYDGIIAHSTEANIEFYNNPAKSKKTKAYINTRSYKHILGKLNNLSHKDLSSLVKIWLNNYNHTIPGYTIINKIDSDHFSNLINKLGYNLGLKDNNYIVKDNTKKVSTNLLDIIDQSIGKAKNSINLKFDHALFLIAINKELEICK